MNTTSTKKILLFGGSGMLGREFLRCFGNSPHYEIISPPHAKVDISNRESVLEIIRETDPHIVINAAVLVDVDMCEIKPDRAYMVGTLGPLFIADALLTLQKKNTIFIQFSSSDVFGSEFAASPSEGETAFSPVNAYSRSKYYAEKCIKSILRDVGFSLYIIRCSWIYSEFKKTFVDAVSQHVLRPVGIFAVAENQRGIPTWGKEIAENTWRLIEERYPFGDYHFVAEAHDGEATRYDIALEIARILGRKDEKSLFSKVPRTQIFKALRPASSAITNTKFPKFRNWKDSLGLFLNGKYSRANHENTF